jgi:hypothetical protein
MRRPRGEDLAQHDGDKNLSRSFHAHREPPLYACFGPPRDGASFGLRLDLANAAPLRPGSKSAQRVIQKHHITPTLQYSNTPTLRYSSTPLGRKRDDDEDSLPDVACGLLAASSVSQRSRENEAAGAASLIIRASQEIRRADTGDHSAGGECD